jgi:hypothetical protein
MKAMYEVYKDLVEFRIVYINEAHAADSDRPVEYAVDKGIKKHTNYTDRCYTADMMMAEENVTIPCLIDNMDNKVNVAYNAHPDRLFLVRKDGTLAVAAGRGPKGFKPALEKANKWLEQYKRTGAEPEI